jgi:hypothetical protein
VTACTGCGEALGDSWCGTCAGKATADRIAAWMDSYAAYVEAMSVKGAGETLRLAAEAVRSGAWRQAG